MPTHDHREPVSARASALKKLEALAEKKGLSVLDLEQDVREIHLDMADAVVQRGLPEVLLFLFNEWGAKELEERMLEFDDPKDDPEEK